MIALGSPGTANATDRPLPSAPPLHISNLRILGEGKRQILSVDTLDIAPGSLIGIRGPSGAGKSTLLHVLAGLVDNAQGTVQWGDINLTDLTSKARTAFRRQHIGMIFQDFLLFNEMTARDNAGIAALYAPKDQRKAIRDRAAQELAQRGLTDTARTVALYSGGERQRVAVARALAHDPAIILGDEPTASLDPDTGAAMIDDLTTLARSQGRTLIVVSHDARLLDQMDRTIGIAAGQLL